MSTAIAKLREELDDKQTNILKAAAAHIRPERFLEQVARACIQNPKLLECTRSSLFMAAAEAAALGLEIDGVLGHAYIVPYKNKATLIPGYLGLKELAYRSNRIADMSFGLVRQGDEFEYEKGTSPFLKHRPSDASHNSQVTHVYAVIHTTSGGVVFEVMSWPQIEEHRNKFAKGYNRPDSAWKTNPQAMALKTVLRKALKLCPLSPEVQQLLQNEEYVESFPSGTEAPTDDLDHETAAALEQLDGPATDYQPMSDAEKEGILERERQEA